MNLLLDIALAHLRHRRRQTLVSTIGVAVGVGFFIATSSLMRGSEQDFLQRMVESYPHIVVKDEFREPPPQPAAMAFPDAAVAIRGLRPREEVRGLRNHKKLLADLSAMPGIAAAPALSGQVILRYAGRDVAAAVTGILPRREREVTAIADDLVGGGLTDLETSDSGIIIGHQLAKRLGVEVGDRVSATPAAGGARLMKVVALLRTGVANVDDVAAYVMLTDAQVLLDRPNVANRINIRLDDPFAASEVARRIESRIGYRAESWQQANADILSLLVIRNIILYAIVGAILLVASFGIFNVVATVVLEKTRDIAILMSMGFQQSDVRRVFVIEGLAVGLVGAVAGWAIGFGLIETLGAIRLEVAQTIQADRLPLDRGFGQYLVAAICAVAAAMLAAWIPARRAARLRPVEILRGAA